MNSILVLLTGADGHPVAIRNTEVLSVDRIEKWTNGRNKNWVYDNVVLLIVPRRENMGYQREDGKEGKYFGWIPVKGPIEDVVFALNQGCHTWRAESKP